MANTMSKIIGDGRQADTMRLYHMLVDDATQTRLTFTASSWNEAMSMATAYLGARRWNTAEYGTLRIPYIVYRLPANSHVSENAELGDGTRLDLKMLQSSCEGRGSIHVERPSEPYCSEPAGHDFVATYGIEGGKLENPGVFAHGEAELAASHCRHCGQTRTINHWDDINEVIIPGGDVRYGGKLEPWPPGNKGGNF